MHLVASFLTAAEVDAVRTAARRLRGWKTQPTGSALLSLNPRQYLADVPVERLQARATAVAGPVVLVLVHYPNGAYLPPHLHAEPYRLYVSVVLPTTGGILTIAGQDLELVPGDAVMLHPDTELHAITPVVGERLLLSCSPC